MGSSFNVFDSRPAFGTQGADSVAKRNQRAWDMTGTTWYPIIIRSEMDQTVRITVGCMLCSTTLGGSGNLRQSALSKHFDKHGAIHN
jgi:hypothetical protein